MSEVSLVPASHARGQDYWRGMNYELNMTFGSLRDDQWRGVLEALWRSPALVGPLNARYLPGGEVATTTIEVPPPTTALTQYGLVWVRPAVGVGCGVLVTRSLFECVSVQIPAGMFEGLSPQAAQRLPALEALLGDLALAVFRQVP
ncbi:MAG: hypothetical protein JW910_05865, partial [Anaerolineae bacterium]|nr:hypothetical protein [Anaerolineae bacterium]